MIDTILSFAVYFVPLITPHVLWTTGAYLLQSGSRVTESVGWVAMDWAVMLAAQAALFCLLRFARRRRPVVRTLLVGGAWIAAVPTLNALLLVTIPLQHLAEASSAPETNTLEEVCRADGVALQPRLTALHVHSTAAAMAVRRHGDNRLALLHVPGCRVQDLDVPADADVGTISPSGAILWRTRESAQRQEGHWFLTTPDGATATAPIMVEGTNVPQVLADGKTVAWMETEPPPRIVTIVEGAARSISGPGVPARADRGLRGIGPQGPFYLSVTGASGVQWLTLDGGGRMTSSIPAPPEVEPYGHHLRPLSNGWIAWDTYRENGRYVITWSIAGRTGTRTLPKGLAFNSVAFDDRGEHIAISASSGLRIGDQRDEVWLLRTSDGAELFRRYAPKYSRAVVALPGGRYFAVDEMVEGRSSVRVYRLGS